VVMNKIAQKSLISSLVIAVPYILVIFSPNIFMYAMFLLIVSIVIAWAYTFGVRFKLASLREKLKFLILPLIFNIGAVYLTTIFFQDFVKIIIAAIVAIANYFLWTSLAKVYNLTSRVALFHRNILIVISFMTVFLGSTTVFRLYMLFSTSKSIVYFQLLLTLLIFGLFYSISSFLTRVNGADEDVKKLRPYNVVNSLLGAEIAWVGSLWIINYPVIAIQEKANLGGTPLPAILLTIIFYFLWGIIFHKLDKSLTRRVLTEYIFVAILFISVLLATARWLPTL